MRDMQPLIARNKYKMRTEQDYGTENKSISIDDLMNYKADIQQETLNRARRRAVRSKRKEPRGIIITSSKKFADRCRNAQIDENINR